MNNSIINKLRALLLVALVVVCNESPAQDYLNNRAPLKSKPYMELPLGSIKPNGWLHEMLIRQKKGTTGQLDYLYPAVMGSRNGWLGGDGDQWERGPYWIDGLLPLAYLLDDDTLKAKAQPWIEWAINSQKPDGYFGPDRDYGPEQGLQRNNAHDWWPKMVMLKILQQYYSATNDERVIKLMTNYFHYQLNTLRTKPLGHWTFWAEYRSGDNLQAVYWLYNITGEKSLLTLAELLHKQGIDFTSLFEEREVLTSINRIHCVNLAQGIKEPIIYYQQNPDQRFIDAVKRGFADIRKFNGQPQGMYGGDEGLHGNVPTQGSEFCSAVELMFSLEKILEITGDVQFAEHLERIAFNALPTQATDDFMARQYFQQANQVQIQRRTYNFNTNHHGTDVIFGLLTGYPCCTSNMHQGWPKFTQNLWYATEDGGLAALVYAPNTVAAKVGQGVSVRITEETRYPFEEAIRFRITLLDDVDSVAFPFHLRLPSWCPNPRIKINGQPWQPSSTKGSIAVIDRSWKSGDTVVLELPMAIHTSSWYENAMAVERGPLIYALKIAERWEKKAFTREEAAFGTHYFEVYPESPWNYGIMAFPKKDTQEVFKVVHKERVDYNYPWNLDNAPIEIKVIGKRMPQWQLYNGMAGPQPHSHTYQPDIHTPEEELTLIPYGCTTLRISEFPVINR